MNKNLSLQAAALTCAVLLCVSIGPSADAQASANSTEADSTIAQISDGAISGSVYHNPDLGLAYQFPSGWSISDQKIQQQAISDSYQFVWTEEVPRKRTPQSSQCAKSLLLASKFPEFMRTNEFNSFVLLIAADPKCMPGAAFPTSTKDYKAADYIATHLGTYFKTVGLDSLDRGRIQTFDWAGRVAFEVRQRFRVTTHGTGTMTVKELLASTLVVPAGRYWAMLMFVAADDTQLSKLKATKIFFDAPQSPKNTQ
jgi:hypothetical protein